MKPLKFQHRVTRTRVKGGKLPELEWLQRPLWIRRVLVRAQEGQLEGPALPRWCWAFFFFAPCYRFCYRFSNAPAARRLTSRTGDSITFNIVASSAC
jgi:hypothetical protein